MAKTPQIDKGKCIGCGICVALAPKTFKLAGDGKAEVIKPPGDSQETIKEVASSCPVEAISLKE